MSNNASGSLWTRRSFLGDAWTAVGAITVSQENDNSYALVGGSAAGMYGCKLSIDVSHTHTYYGDVETRPQNYTVRIWKRTA